MYRSILRLLACSAALALPARSQTVLFSEGFENGLANWTATGLWHVVDTGDSCGAQVAPFPEGTHCAYYGIPGACNYDTGTTNSGTLTLSAPIALPAGGPAARLYCWTRHQTETCNAGNSYDNFDVQVSINGGSSWIMLGRRCDLDTQAADAWAVRGMSLSGLLGQSILLRFVFDTVDDQFNDFRGAFVDRIEVRLEAGNAFCTTTCPCAGPFNDLSIGYGLVSGCTNSETREGELAGGGTPSVASDTVVLNASELDSPSVALFIQSDTLSFGLFNGDGRYCLTGTPLRLGARPAPSGSASLPGPGDPPLSVLGGVPPIGAVRHYQVAYRDPALWCTSSTFNYTNGYTITWSP